MTHAYNIVLKTFPMQSDKWNNTAAIRISFTTIGQNKCQPDRHMLVLYVMNQHAYLIFRFQSSLINDANEL